MGVPYSRSHRGGRSDAPADADKGLKRREVLGRRNEEVRVELVMSVALYVCDAVKRRVDGEGGERGGE